MITPDLLAAAIGCPRERAQIFAGPLSEACALFEINTPARVAAFLAQLAHESGALKFMAELASGDAYEGRADLGNTQPGDGRRFKGHGPIQITGRFNHRAVRPALLLAGYEDVPDFEAEPDRLTEPRWGCAAAAEFWARNGLNAMADRGEFDRISKAINRGNPDARLPANGDADRRARWERARAALAALASNPQAGTAEAPSAPISPPPAPSPPPRYMPAGEFIPEEPTMPPFIAAAIPALLDAAPSLIRIFGDSPQAERNAKAAEAVAQIAKQATGETTVEGAVTAIQTDPTAAAAYREAVHQKLGDLVSLLILAGDADDKSRAAALDRNVALGKATGGKWLWLLGGIAALVVLVSYAITAGVLFSARTTFSDETKALLLGQIVIFGFVTVLAFLFGSNIQNRINQREQQQRGE